MSSSAQGHQEQIHEEPERERDLRGAEAAAFGRALLEKALGGKEKVEALIGPPAQHRKSGLQ